MRLAVWIVCFNDHCCKDPNNYFLRFSNISAVESLAPGDCSVRKSSISGKISVMPFGPFSLSFNSSSKNTHNRQILLKLYDILMLLPLEQISVAFNECFLNDAVNTTQMTNALYFEFSFFFYMSRQST